MRLPHLVEISEAGIALDEEPALAVDDARPPIMADNWQLEQRSRNLSRKLRLPIGEIHRRLDGPEDSLDELVNATASPAIVPVNYSVPRSSPKSPELAQYFAWFTTLLGFTMLGGGLGGVAWIIVCDRTEFWNHAIAATLAGQGVLILGLVLVVTRLWRHSRYAGGKLQQVHTELAQLQRTADAISAMRNGGAPAFYGELVRGASPQMLLSNLKGQLEQLTTRLEGVR